MMRRLLFAHAHPDDEASKGAATAAKYADDGATVVLATFTGGEAGEVLNPSHPPVPPERMREVRAVELKAAVDAIGFTRAHQLGYVDSGYHENLDDVPAGCFARVPLDEAATAFAAILRAERPHVVVTYPEDGGYPHPDHIRTHTVTMRAIELADDGVLALTGDGRELEPWRVPKVYASHIFPHERIRALYAALTFEGREPDEFTRRLLDRLENTPEVAPHARIWCADHFPRRDAALRAHATQVDPEGAWFEVSRELEREHYPYEPYELLYSDVPSAPPEDDLFAGLDLGLLDAANGRVDRVAR